jgi:membrane protease YdiL (CAAX protease family)
MSDSANPSALRAFFLHPLVKLVVGLVAVVAAMVVAGLAWEKLAGSLDLGHWDDVLRALVVVSVAMLAYAGFVRWVERRPVTELGRDRAAREWAVGVALGFGAISLTVAVIAGFGGYRITGTNPASVLVPVLAMAIFSGVFEEIVIRGLVFRLLEEWLGSWTALALSALLFGLLHIMNPNATLLAAVAISIEAGILLAAVYMLTRRLWMAIGLHMAWNFTQGGVFGISVSGVEMKGLLFNTMQGPPLLTGGAFGAEASLPAILVCTSLGVWLLYRAHRKGRFVAASWHRFRTGQPAAAVVPAQA